MVTDLSATSKPRAGKGVRFTSAATRPRRSPTSTASRVADEWRDSHPTIAAAIDEECEEWMANRRFLDMDALSEILAAEREGESKLIAVS